jgi:Large polyvalent protein associated domain 30/Large polyvalent protein associated domain 29
MDEYRNSLRWVSKNLVCFKFDGQNNGESHDSYRSEGL